MSLFHRPSTPTVSVDDAANRAVGHVLVDVRGIDEWRVGHAPDALHLPLDRLGDRRLPADQRLLVVCRSGNRSARAVGILRNAGYDAHNVAGGMAAWAAAGHPVVRDDGRPGSVLKAGPSAMASTAPSRFDRGEGGHHQ